MKIKVILSAIALVAISSTSFGQNQTARVKDGIKSGEITKSEAAKIKEKRQETQATVKDAKADGVVTPEEKLEIERKRKEASRTIYRKKHNDVEKK